MTGFNYSVLGFKRYRQTPGYYEGSHFIFQIQTHVPRKAESRAGKAAETGARETTERE